MLGLRYLGFIHSLDAVHPQTAVLRFRQQSLDLSEQSGPPFLLFRFQQRRNKDVLGGDAGGPGLGQGNSIIVVAATGLLNVVVVTVRPNLPTKKFFLTGKVLAGQPDMYAGGAGADDGILVKFIQSKIALGIKHNFLHFVCGNLRAENRNGGQAGRDTRRSLLSSPRFDTAEGRILPLSTQSSAVCLYDSSCLYTYTVPIDR